MTDKLLALEPTNLKEVHAGLDEAIAGLRLEAEQKLASIQSNPKAAASVKEALLTIETLVRATRDIGKLETTATAIMHKVWKRLQKQQPAQ